MFKRNNNRYLSLEKPKRKNRLLLWSISFIFLIILACVIAAFILYNHLYDIKTAGMDDTKEQILDQTSIVEIDQVELFNGEKPYHVVYGKNDQDEEKIIFHPLEGKERNITTIDASEILSKEQMVHIWQLECESCRFIEISPALIDEKPLWEIAYRDAQDRYVLAYYSMYDATKYEQLLFKSMFN